MENTNMTFLASLAVSGFLAVPAQPASAQVQVDNSGAPPASEPAQARQQVQVNVAAKPATPASPTVVNNVQAGDSRGGRPSGGRLMVAGGTLFGVTYLPQR